MGKTRKSGEPSPFLHPGAADALVLAATSLTDGPQPVAVVLEDGSVRSLLPQAEGRSCTSGLLSGRDWTFWWERRSWVGA